MRHVVDRVGTCLLALCVVTALSACGLPRPGPSTSEIRDAGATNPDEGLLIVPVTEAIVHATAAHPSSALSSAFLNASVLDPDVINAGDQLALTIYENVDDGLLSTPHNHGAELAAIEVDGDGFVFLPYIGRVRAAGNSTDGLRRMITSALESQTPEPQVIVRRVPGDGATVSVLGAVGAQGVYPIGRANPTLSSMLAAAGGLSIPPELARLTVMRNGTRGHVWLEDLYQDARLDVALRGGDRILVEQDARSFIALGATGTQQQLPFEARSISVLEAIARVGGLSSDAAAPDAVFVLRREPADIARRVLSRSDIDEPARLIYAFDLTEPNGMFLSRAFDLRDGDVIYVGEASYVNLQRILGAFSGTLRPLNTVRDLGD